MKCLIIALLLHEVLSYNLILNTLSVCGEPGVQEERCSLQYILEYDRNFRACFATCDLIAPCTRKCKRVCPGKWSNIPSLFWFENRFSQLLVKRLTSGAKGCTRLWHMAVVKYWTVTQFFPAQHAWTCHNAHNSSSISPLYSRPISNGQEMRIYPGKLTSQVDYFPSS